MGDDVVKLLREGIDSGLKGPTSGQSKHCCGFSQLLWKHVSFLTILHLPVGFQHSQDDSFGWCSFLDWVPGHSNHHYSGLIAKGSPQIPNALGDFLCLRVVCGSSGNSASVTQAKGSSQWSDTCCERQLAQYRFRKRLKTLHLC